MNEVKDLFNTEVEVLLPSRYKNPHSNRQVWVPGFLLIAIKKDCMILRNDKEEVVCHWFEVRKKR